MNLVTLSLDWFKKWEAGNFHDLPLTENFRHISPYGTIDGKKAYMELVEANKDAFLGHRFEIHDTLSNDQCVCIRYTAIKQDFQLEVTEWHYFEKELIREVISYYNIEDRQLPEEIMNS